MPAGSTGFWLAVAALLALLAMHAVYWLVTHPVNNFWLKDVEQRAAGAGFFSFDPLKRTTGPDLEWTYLRDRWEFSHELRAGFALLSLILLVTAIAL
jgi:Domain of unknown function (DUF1772)